MTIGNIFNIFATYVGSLAVLFIFIGGVVLLVSHGNRTAEQYGRQMLGASFKGMVVILFSWLIINFAITAIVNDRKIFGREWFTFVKSEEIVCYIPVVDTPKTPPPQPTNAPVPAGWILRCSSAQVAHASPELTELINCVYTHVPKVRINSISDDDIFTGNCKVSDCNKEAKTKGLCPANIAAGKCKSDAHCVHTCGSCHYYFGTEGGTGFSQGVDFKIEGNQTEIKNAVITCGGKTFMHADHVHASTQACPGT